MNISKLLIALISICLFLGATVLWAGSGNDEPEPLGDPIEDEIEEGPIQVGLEIVATGLTAPNWGINSPAPGDANRLFVTDQPGILWAIELGSGRKRIFLDVSSRLVPLGVAGPGSFDERGLLGVAFHSDYAMNGLLYTYTSEPANQPPDFSTMPAGQAPNHQSVIAEWQVPAPGDRRSSVDPSSRREILRIDQPQFNHNAGAMNFGQDGLLYIALGDGGGADDQGTGHTSRGNGQNPRNILGTIIRIDPLGSNSSNGQYGIPSDNPFVGRRSLVEEIWAYGFRNPFRFSFDRETGLLYTADAGQNDIEEMDVVLKGQNHGWRVKEGSFLFDPNGDDPGFVFEFSPGSPRGMIDPFAEYDHDEGVVNVGGFVYRGANPELQTLRGHYVFGDFARRGNNQGRLFEADVNGISERDIRRGVNREIFEMLDGTIDGSLLGFGQDANGEIYLLINETGVPFENTGQVLKIVAPCEDNSGDNNVCND